LEKGMMERWKIGMMGKGKMEFGKIVKLVG
jgi:hypothetical protein